MVADMREMKDSGIEWIGKIPTDWYAVRIKYLSKRIIVGLAMPVTQYYVVDGVPIFRNTNIEEDYLDDKELLYLEPRFAYSQRSKKIKTNDILTIHTGYVGKSCLVPKEYDGALTFTTLITTADKSMVLPRFLMYTINASREKSSIYIVDSSAQNNLNTAVFINLPLPKPSIDEQKALVVFLDSKCAEIDALYKEIENQIKTLEEYKRSVITEAVTKGLNPDSETKNSEIFYMAPYNKTWKLSKIGYECSKLHRSFLPEDNPLICTNKGKVILRPEDMTGKMVSEDNAMQGIHKGDIAIHGMDTWHGAIALSKHSGKITRVVHVCDSKQDKRFIVYYLQQLAFNGVYKLISNGVRGNTSDFRSWEKVKNIYIALPTIEEQAKISDYLDRICSETEMIITKKKELLEVLDHYKKSLIYEYVTGKKEVPAT